MGMRFKDWFRIITVLTACIGFLSVHGQDIPSKPNPPRLVNDYAGILLPEQKTHLEQLLVAYDDTSSVQIAIVTIESLNGADIADFAIELGRKWGVGNKKTNNGVVILFSKNDRKIFIAPGYGLEARLPDYTCKQIIDVEMIPDFKQGNFYRGLEEGAIAIIQATRGEYSAPEGYANRGEGSGGGLIFLFIIIFIIFLIIMGRRGGGGGNGGDAMTRRGHRHLNTPPFIFFPPIGGGGGGRGGGGWSGGGGGGFGGFGGGGFGGGGAGGSW